MSEQQKTKQITRENRAIGNRLRATRERLGQTQAAFGAVLGMSRVGYSHYEQARAPISTEKLLILAKRFGFSADDVLEEPVGDELGRELDILFSNYRYLSREQRASVRAYIRLLRDEAGSAAGLPEQDGPPREARPNDQPRQGKGLGTSGSLPYRWAMG